MRTQAGNAWQDLGSKGMQRRKTSGISWISKQTVSAVVLEVCEALISALKGYVKIVVILVRLFPLFTTEISYRTVEKEGVRVDVPVAVAESTPVDTASLSYDVAMETDDNEVMPVPDISTQPPMPAPCEDFIPGDTLENTSDDMFVTIHIAPLTPWVHSTLNVMGVTRCCLQEGKKLNETELKWPQQQFI
ncbi:hypothetical protein O3P69_015508 [Scylla paramamosain]|uniref:Uncharacterized protein n=1 Tax=Scylla paramamosain TaxID=85552 RepID=A0AAW0T5Q3_SCYPA